MIIHISLEETLARLDRDKEPAAAEIASILRRRLNTHWRLGGVGVRWPIRNHTCMIRIMLWRGAIGRMEETAFGGYVSAVEWWREKDPPHLPGMRGRWVLR